MVKAFLLRRDMPAVLRVLVNLLIHHCHGMEETSTINLSPPVYTAPADAMPTKVHELTPEERERLLPLEEPDRCFEW
jgi:chromatin structure-remodeling complex subunit RSC9